MSTVETLNRFSKNGDLSKFHRRYVNLTHDQKAKLVELLEKNVPVEKAIRECKREH